MAGFVIYVTLFLAGVTWGLAAGFGAALFAREGSGGTPAGPGPLTRTFVAALVTGLGGSGALLTRAGRFGAGTNFGFALLTGMLFAALVTIATRIVLEEGTRATSR